ncbi:hypothetical protein KC669_04050 [Candidatus Dojkabacteria bacterium]|uniref:Uncharacterized protein n=1 Tax=Candidatus Dojkabacteria bacterium TaxID=2099670 RepID=A0A955RMA9_9BACT|nr:hypothetical protein [Candidatus Dojkabacteria bacterium]
MTILETEDRDVFIQEKVDDHDQTLKDLIKLLDVEAKFSGYVDIHELNSMLETPQYLSIANLYYECAYKLYRIDAKNLSAYERGQAIILYNEIVKKSLSYALLEHLEQTVAEYIDYQINEGNLDLAREGLIDNEEMLAEARGDKHIPTNIEEEMAEKELIYDEIGDKTLTEYILFQTNNLLDEIHGFRLIRHKSKLYTFPNDNTQFEYTPEIKRFIQNLRSMIRILEIRKEG